MSKSGAHGGDEAWIEKYRAALQDVPAKRSRFENALKVAKSVGAALSSWRDAVFASRDAVFVARDAVFVARDAVFANVRKFLANTKPLAEGTRRSSPEIKTRVKRRAVIPIRDDVKKSKAG